MRDADFWIGWSGAGGPPWGARTSRGWSPGDWREPDCGAAPTASGLPAPFSTAPPDATAAAFPVEIPAASPRLGLGAPPAEGPPDAGVPFPAPTIRVNPPSTVSGVTYGEVSSGKALKTSPTDVSRIVTSNSSSCRSSARHPLAPRAAGEDQAVDDAGGGEDGQDEEELYDHPFIMNAFRSEYRERNEIKR